MAQTLHGKHGHMRVFLLFRERNTNKNEEEDKLHGANFKARGWQLVLGQPTQH